MCICAQRKQKLCISSLWIELNRIVSMVNLLRAQMCFIQFLIGLRSVQIVLMLLFGWFNILMVQALFSSMLKFMRSVDLFVCFLLTLSVCIFFSLICLSLHSYVFDFEIGATQFSSNTFLYSSLFLFCWKIIPFSSYGSFNSQLTLIFARFDYFDFFFSLFLFLKFSFPFRTWLLCHSINSFIELLLFMWFL